MPKLTIDNFSGRLTRIVNGDINSGFAKFNTTYGSNPLATPKQLTWFEQPTSILTTTEPITGLKPRMESGTQYVYASEADIVSSVASLYKIQVNNTSTD